MEEQEEQEGGGRTGETHKCVCAQCGKDINSHFIRIHERLAADAIITNDSFLVQYESVGHVQQGQRLICCCHVFSFTVIFMLLLVVLCSVI